MVCWRQSREFVAARHLGKLWQQLAGSRNATSIDFIASAALSSSGMLSTIGIIEDAAFVRSS
jgi:hypothetical protein